MVVLQEGRNELSERTYRGPGVESIRVREPRRTALPRGPQSQVLWWWGEFLDCLWPIILPEQPSWFCMHCSAKMYSSVRVSGRLSGPVLSSLFFLAPPKLSWLVSVGTALSSLLGPPVASRCQGAQPRWAVLVTQFPNSWAVYTAPVTTVFYPDRNSLGPGAFPALSTDLNWEGSLLVLARSALECPSQAARFSDGLACRNCLLFGILEALSSRPLIFGPFFESDESINLHLGACRAHLSAVAFSSRKDKWKSHYSTHGNAMAVSFEPLGKTLLAWELYIILDPLRAIIYLTGYL